MFHQGRWSKLAEIDKGLMTHCERYGFNSLISTAHCTYCDSIFRRDSVIYGVIASVELPPLVDLLYAVLVVAPRY